MRTIITIIIGALLTALLGYAAHGPLGGGAAFIDRLESRADVALGNAGGALMQLSVVREPAFVRIAHVSGSADAAARARLLAGIRAVPGMRDAQWVEDAASHPAPRGMPLLAEALLLLGGAYTAGLAIGWLLWGRRSG